jgi:hypothetical protein
MSVAFNNKRNQTYKAVVPRAQNIGNPLSMTKITDQREGAEQWEDELGKPFVAEHDRSDYSKELKGALGHGGVLVHSIEEGDVREDPRVVDVRWAHKNISIDSDQPIAHHLSADKESNSPSRIYFLAVVQLHGRQRAQSVGSIALSRSILTGNEVQEMLTLPQYATTMRACSLAFQGPGFKLHFQPNVLN